MFSSMCHFSSLRRQRLFVYLAPFLLSLALFSVHSAAFNIAILQYMQLSVFFWSALSTVLFSAFLWFVAARYHCDSSFPWP